MKSSARASSSSIETPGRSSSPIIASVSATISPARAMPWSSCRDLRRIIDGRPSSNGYLFERLLNLVEHLVHGSVSLHPDDDPLRAVVLDERLGLAVIDLEPARDHVGRVVLAALLLRALEQPLHAGLVGDLELEDDRELARDLAQ